MKINRRPFRVLMFLSLALGSLLVSRAWGETQAVAAPTNGVSVPSESDGLYHRALGAYLSGDYDQALLLAAQSLDKDPAHQKTRNLIAILATEKEQEGKTVIWLSGKPSVVPVDKVPTAATPLLQDNSKLEEAIAAVRSRIERIFGAQNRRNAQVDAQMQVIQELVKTNGESQYGEVRESQAQIYKKLENLEKGQDLRLLYLLCGVSLLFSLLSVFRKRKEG